MRYVKKKCCFDVIQSISAHDAEKDVLSFWDLQYEKDYLVLNVQFSSE